MVGERRDVFTKRVLVENTLAVSCVKIQGGPWAPLAPSVDDHASDYLMASKILISIAMQSLHINLKFIVTLASCSIAFSLSQSVRFFLEALMSDHDKRALLYKQNATV